MHNLTGRYIVHPEGAAAAHSRFGANMGEVIRFISKSERERARLIREARATYDSVFPPADPVSEQLDEAPSSADAHRDGGLLP